MRARARAEVAEAELVGLAPRAAFDGFPDDVPLRGFDPERHLIEERAASASGNVASRWPRRSASARASTAARRPGRSSAPAAPGAPQTARRTPSRSPRQRRAGAASTAAHLARRVNRAAIAAAVFGVLVVARCSSRSVAPGVDPRRLHVPALHPARLLHRHGALPLPPAAEAAARQARRHGRARCSPSGRWRRTRYIFRRDGSDRALIVDPGDEADKLLGAIDGARRRSSTAILLTHTHFDHVGAVAPVARATGAEVWVPEIEKLVLADIMSFVPVAGLRAVRVLRRRAHARGRRAARAGRLRDRRALHAGPQPRPRDVLDPGRAGRSSPATCCSRARSAAPTCPAATGATLLESIRALVDSLPERDDGLPRPHGHHHAGRRAGHQPVPGRARRERDGRSSRPRGARSTCCPTDGAAPARARRASPTTCSAAPATSRSRRRSSRTPSCSRAAWGRPPTSSRRRCSPSRTRPAAR